VLVGHSGEGLTPSEIAAETTQDIQQGLSDRRFDASQTAISFATIRPTGPPEPTSPPRRCLQYRPSLKTGWRPTAGGRSSGTARHRPGTV
jgi:hypothetical protein